MTPTLSDVQRWTPDDLASTADHWNKQADLVERVFTSAHNQVNQSSWQGQGSEMARTHYGGNLGAVIAHAAEMRAAAQTANLEAAALSNLKANLIAEVNAARQQQFQVDDNFQVTDDPSFTSTEQFLRQPILLAHQATLTAQRDAFITAEQGAATSLQGHGETLGSFTFPDSKPPYNYWCKDSELPADGVGRGDGCLEMGGTDRWPAYDKWGNESPGSFNDVPIDTSHASTSGIAEEPWDAAHHDRDLVPRDWPGMPLPLTGQPAPPSSQPFLPNLLPSLTAPPTGGAPARTAGWSQAPFIPQPPVPTPSQPDVSPVSPIAPPDLPPPRVPAGIATPPVMTAPPPNDGYFEPSLPDPGMPPEQHPEWTAGSILTNAGMGCAAGAGFGATLGALVPPAETVLPEIGCVEGALGGAGASVLGPALNNMLNGNG
jgi:hypothetical protein